MRVVTVGAGPCGLYASRLLSGLGHEVTILEEHPSVGRPVQCAGLVGTPVVERFGREAVINTIDSALIRLGTRSLELHRPGVAHVLDRTRFDASFASGLDIATSSHVTGVRAAGDGTYRVDAAGTVYEADLVIGADGPCSVVRKSMGFSAEVRQYTACQERIVQDVPDEHHVLVEVCRPFFSWAIPEGGGILRVGTFGKQRDLDAFKEHAGLSGGVIERTVACVPVGKAQLARGGAVLVGDAAAQTKPLSGGGIYYGMCAAEFLASAVEAEDLSLYPAAWQRAFGREVSFGLAARRIYERMSPHDLSRVFDILCENKERIEDEADFDRHSSLARLFIGNPRLFAVLGRYLFSVFS